MTQPLITSPSSGTRLPGIEGLRALAAGSILVYHVWLYSSPSGGAVELGRIGSFAPDLQFGVALFFALSGFLLYWPFAAGVLRGGGGPSSRRYFRNRALRILPAYWVILLVCALVLQSVQRPGGTSGSLHDPFLLFQSLLFVQNYSADQVITGIGPAWSLNVEVVFYVLLPALAYLAFALAGRFGRVAAALAPAAFLLLLGLTGKAVAAYAVPPIRPFDGWESDWHSVIERSFLGQADLFAFGMALAVVRVLWEQGRIRLPQWWRLPTTLVAASALLLVTAKATNSGEQLSYSPWNTVIALDFALFLALVVLVESRDLRGSRLVRALEWRPLVIVGVVSYSVFLWHEPLVRWLQAHDLTAPGAAGFLVNLAVTASIALLLSVATFRLVEGPSLRLKRRSTPPGDLQARAAATAEVSAAP